jgi:hypothetical protein
VNADWAWAAGLFEGEGSIILSRRHYRQPQLWLRTTDPDVLERFVQIVGAGRITECALRECHTKPQYSWCICSRSEVRRILLQMRPWLGRRRAEKADEVLAFIDAKEGNPPVFETALTALERDSA